MSFAACPLDTADRKGCSRGVRQILDVLVVQQIAAQPALRELSISDAHIMTCPNDGRERPLPLSNVMKLTLENVEVHPRSLTALLHKLPRLNHLRWSRSPDPCTWEVCRCHESPIPTLYAALNLVQTTLVELHHAMRTRLETLQPPHCTRDCQVLPTLQFLACVTVLTIPAELLLGRTFCEPDPLAPQARKYPAHAMRGMLPPQIRRLTILVDVM